MAMEMIFKLESSLTGIARWLLAVEVSSCLLALGTAPLINSFKLKSLIFSPCFFIELKAIH